MINDVEAILKVCGLGRYLHIGCGQGSLLFQLLKRSVDAFGMDPNEALVKAQLDCAPGRFVRGTLLDHPFEAKSFDTVIIGDELLQYKPEHFNALFRALRSLAKRQVVMCFTSEGLAIARSRPETASRLNWEKLAIAGGLRLHPRAMQVFHFNMLEDERVQTLNFFECVPETALEHYPLDWLLKNRDLHMDMLREVGRRSDGHTSRYVIAATKIREGDVVLDAACGLGYGTAIMAAASTGAQFIGVDIDPTSVEYAHANFAINNPAISYRAADVAQLHFIPDHSIDMVVSFETIEHVPDYEIFLAEVKRVLKPDGRFIGSVPNLWCDETGRDPNPYHYHVFDWFKFKTAIGKHFIVEDRYAQTAGGGFKLWDKPRNLQQVSLTAPDHMQTEWWIISACVDPRGAELPYANSFEQEDATIAQHVDFGRYYDNPWIYRTMVQLGSRIHDRDVLMQFCQSIANSARPGSADLGAALCVLAYQFLEFGMVNTSIAQQLVSSINIYDQDYQRDNPHCLRWAISLHYVAARILLLFGNRKEALQAFMACAAMDPLAFSPLLTTKILSAAMYAGMIFAGDNCPNEAAACFRQGMQAAQKALQGNWQHMVGDIDQPLSFGWQEVAEVADLASQCAHALNALERGMAVPGFLWDRLNLRRFGLVEWTKSVEQENQRLRQYISAKSVARVNAAVA